jgi:hypothetical protein
MFGSRTAEKAAKAGKDAKNRGGQTASLPEALRIDRAGTAISDRMPVLVQKLPSADDARDTIVGTAQRAIERARDGVGTALDQLPVDLPVARRRKRRSGPPLWLLIMGGIAAASAAGFIVYRKMFGGPYDDDYGIDRDWPAEPNPGTVNEKPESDAEVAQDAAESAAVLSGTSPSVDAASTTADGSH